MVAEITTDVIRALAAAAGLSVRTSVSRFSGYAGWDRGQLAAEVRGGSRVLDPADAATVFSPEPLRLWEKVHEIRARIQAQTDPAAPVVTEAAARVSR